MFKRNKEEAGVTSLHVFLIQRFVIAALFVYVLTQITNLVYRFAFLPILQNVLQVSQIGYTGDTIGAVVELLLVAIGNGLAGQLPAFLQTPITRAITTTVGTNLNPPDFISQYGPYMVRLYYTAMIVIIALQFLITMMPYIAAGWWYCSSINRKMKEIRVFEAERKAELDRQRNLLFSDIVHDIKTPITTIVGYSQALNTGMLSSDPEKQQDYLQAIYNKSLRISDLISMLFEFVKLDSAGFTLHTEQADLAELLRETVITLYTDFEDKGLLLDFDITEELCPATIDKMQMSRVITNLLTNAIRYSSPGCRVLVSMQDPKPDDKYYLLTVADSGLEISREFAEHIFEPFSRSDEARATTSGGSGLGLSIAKKVANMHGGDLILNLDYGEGYTKAFQILVPRI